MSPESLEGGKEIFKYGKVIEIDSVTLGWGAWIHTNNVESTYMPLSKLL